MEEQYHKHYKCDLKQHNKKKFLFLKKAIIKWQSEAVRTFMWPKMFRVVPDLTFDLAQMSQQILAQPSQEPNNKPYQQAFWIYLC